MRLKYFWRILQDVEGILLILNVVAIAVLIASWAKADVSPVLEGISKLALAFISSTMFYIIVVYLPKVRRKQRIARYLNNYIAEIDDRWRRVIVAIRVNAGQPLDPKYAIPDAEEIQRFCTLIDPLASPSTQFFVRAGNWLDCLDGVKRQTLADLQSVFHFNDLISEGLLGTLTELDDLLRMHLPISQPIANKKLSAWAYAIRSARILSDRASTEYTTANKHFLDRASDEFRTRAGV